MDHLAPPPAWMLESARHGARHDRAAVQVHDDRPALMAPHYDDRYRRDTAILTEVDSGYNMEW